MKIKDKYPKYYLWQEKHNPNYFEVWRIKNITESSFWKAGENFWRQNEWIAYIVKSKSFLKTNNHRLKEISQEEAAFWV